MSWIVVYCDLGRCVFVCVQGRCALVCWEGVCLCAWVLCDCVSCAGKLCVFVCCVVGKCVCFCVFVGLLCITQKRVFAGGHGVHLGTRLRFQQRWFSLFSQFLSPYLFPRGSDDRGRGRCGIELADLLVSCVCFLISPYEKEIRCLSLCCARLVRLIPAVAACVWLRLASPLVLSVSDCPSGPTQITPRGKGSRALSVL